MENQISFITHNYSECFIDLDIKNENLILDEIINSDIHNICLNNEVKILKYDICYGRYYLYNEVKISKYDICYGRSYLYSNNNTIDYIHENEELSKIELENTNGLKCVYAFNLYFDDENFVKFIKNLEHNFKNTIYKIFVNGKLTCKPEMNNDTIDLIFEHDKNNLTFLRNQQV